MNNTLNLALRRTSRELSVDLKIVEAVYRSYWGFIKHTIESIPIKEMTKEELASVDHNFNIPYIGKLYVDDEKIDKYHRRLKFLQDVKTKKNKADRLSSVSD